MKKIVSLVVAFAALSLFVPAGQSTAEILPRTLTVSPFVGGYVFEGNQKLENGPVYGLALGYTFSSHWAAEAVATFADTKLEEGSKSAAEVYGVRLDVLYHFQPDQKFVPYLAFGVGGIITDIDDGHDVDSESDEDGLLDYGFGIKYFFYENAAFRADIRHILDLNISDEKDDGVFNNLAATVGIVMHFGGCQIPQTATAWEEEIDMDHDGIVNSYDRCPNTPAGTPVNGFGCPRGHR